MHSYHSNIVTLHAAVFAQREAPARNVAALPSGQGVAFHPSVCLSVCLSPTFNLFEIIILQKLQIYWIHNARHE